MTALVIKFNRSAKSLLSATCLVLLVCASTFSQTVNETAVKFDEFGDILASDLIARLDNLAVQLQNAPNTKAFLVVYRTGRDLPGLSNRYAHRMEGYLVATRRIDPARVVTVDGGEASCLTQEIWIVPPGATPKPRDDAYQRSYHPAVYKFDEQYFGEKGDLYYWRDSASDLYEGFGLELQKHPQATGYLIAYRPRTGKTPLDTARNFLIKHFGIKPGRLKTIAGGYREVPALELWIAEGKGAVPIISSYRYLPRRH
jgi:hypothetical protein